MTSSNKVSLTHSAGIKHAANMLKKRASLFDRQTAKKERHERATILQRVSVALVVDVVRPEMICPFCHSKHDNFEVGGGETRNVACAKCLVIRRYYVDRTLVKCKNSRNVFTRTR